MNRRAIIRRFFPAACAGLGLTAAAHAQTLIRSVDGAGIYDRMGAAVANAGDVNNDGRPDLLVGAAEDYMVFFYEPGYVRVISGADGSVIRTHFGDDDGELFGSALAGIGDVNNDGFDEIAVGASYGVVPGGVVSSGYVRVFNGSDGSVLWTVYGDEGDEFGFSVAAAGDVNGDGVVDVVAGAPSADLPGGLNQAGTARVLSGSNGALIHEILGTASGQRVGYSVAGMGNVNAADQVVYGNPPVPGPDIFDDVLIGSLFAGAKIYSGHDMSVLASFNAGGSSDVYGRAVGSVADLNGDGVREALIGATQEDFFNPGPGYVHVRSGRKGTGQVLHTLDGVTNGERFGYAVEDAGDWDGDGKNDVLVSATTSGNAIPSYAAMFSGDDGSLMFTIDPINAGEHAGYSVAGIGDGDGDGKAEIAIGVPEAQPAGLGSGTVRVYESPFAQTCGSVVDYCAASVNSSGNAAVLSTLGTTGVAADDLVLFASGLPQNPVSNPGVYFYGNNSTNIPFGTGTQCVIGPIIKRIAFAPAQPGGIAFHALDIAGEPDPTYQITPGSTWYFQYWFRDSVGGGPNFTNALEISFCN